LLDEVEAAARVGVRRGLARLVLECWAAVTNLDPEGLREDRGRHVDPCVRSSGRAVEDAVVDQFAEQQLRVFDYLRIEFRA
jgi:hypothetical protein